MLSLLEILGARRLPLFWLRLPFWIATIGLSVVCIAVGAQALQRSQQLENSLHALGMQNNVSIMFDMNDIVATSRLLTVIASLIAVFSIVYTFILLIDGVKFLSHRKSQTKLEGGEDNEKLPLSTRTLRLQILVLSLLSLILFTGLVPSTLFARTGHAHLTIQPSNPTLMSQIDTRYWDYGFLRCLAAAPWFTLIFSIPTILISWVALSISKSPLTSRKV